MRPRCGSGRRPKPGRKKAEKYLLVACTELYTHYLLGDRDLATFKAFVLADLTDSVLVHDRYHLYDSAELGALTHQLCCQHLCRDLDGAAEVYPDAHWPAQIARALRALMHQANLARDAGHATIDDAVKNKRTGLRRNRGGRRRRAVPDSRPHGRSPRRPPRGRPTRWWGVVSRAGHGAVRGPDRC